MQRIEQIIKDSSEQIKQILLEEARKFKNFPKTLIGTYDPKDADAEPIIFREVISPGDVSLKGIALEKPGIIIYSNDDFWTAKHYIIMTPEGLYKFRASMFKETENGKPTDYIKPFPDEKTKRENPEDYFVHGPKTLYEIKKLLER